VGRLVPFHVISVSGSRPASATPRRPSAAGRRLAGCRL
jgi:hypothetical protein